MHYMSDQPLSFRWPKEFIARIDVAREDVSRSLWVRRAVERALGENEPCESAVGSGSVSSAASIDPAPAEQPRKTRKQHSRPNARITRVSSEMTQTPSEPSGSSPAASQKPTGAIPNRPLSRTEAFRQATQRKRSS